MARTPTQTPDDNQPATPSTEDQLLMQEIDEAVRKDDAQEFFSKYGKGILGGLSVLLVGLFGYWWWDSTTEAALEDQSVAIIDSLELVEADKFAEASEMVEPLIEDGSPGARTVARLLQAAAALEQSEPARAVELYAAVQADEQAPQPMRDLALIREVATNFDDREPSDVIAKLSGLAVPGNAYFGSAAEMVAIAHLEEGNEAEAGALFGQIARDENTPESLRSRARQMAGLLGVDAIEDVEQLLEDEGVIPAEGAGE